MDTYPYEMPVPAQGAIGLFFMMLFVYHVVMYGNPTPAY